MLTSLTLQSSLRSVLIHIAAILLLVLSFDFPSRKTPQRMSQMNIVEAVAVDSTQVEKELQRLQELDTAKAQEELAKQQKLEQQVRELEKKSTQAETKRKEEEKRLVDLEKKKLQEQKARETEQKKLADLKKQQEELERKRKQDEDQARKAEAEKQRKEEEEAARQKQLAEQQAEQQGQDQALLQSITANIYRSVVSNYNVSGLAPGLECVLIVRTVPGGEVVSVSISQSSGNEIFDRRAINAVQKASPLPLPEDPATFERLGLRQFRLPFRPQ